MKNKDLNILMERMIKNLDYYEKRAKEEELNRDMKEIMSDLERDSYIEAVKWIGLIAIFTIIGIWIGGQL